MSVDFYCCYLLRSVNKPQSLYLGSTPHSVRRLRQHNGSLVNGGAYRTKKLGSRPWEMLLCVYGFPNRIVALKFEHAWQHGYSTHFIDPDERIIHNKNQGRSITHKIAFLRQLLLHPYFKKMNLTVHFFNLEAKKVWDKNKFNIKIPLQETSQVAVSSGALERSRGELSVDEVLAYAKANLNLVETMFKEYIEHINTTLKHQSEILSKGPTLCNICGDQFDYTSENLDLKPLISFCYHPDCSFVSHLNCLRDHMLKHDVDTLIPTMGNCIQCDKMLRWTHLVKYSTKIKALYGTQNIQDN